MSFALSTGDRGGAGNREAGEAQGGRRRGDGVPGRHQVVDDHHPDRPRWPDSLGVDDELACGGDPTLGRGQLSTVGPVGGQRQDRGNSDRDATSAQDASRVPGQPLDVLAAAATGDRGGGRDRDEANRPSLQFGDGRRQRVGQWPRQVAATPLLVGQQAGSRDPGVVRRDRHRRQPRRGRIRAVPARSGERLPAPVADGPAGGRAASALARQGQIGQDGEHARTVPPSAGTR
jgi:hypothetical protein